MRLSEVLALRWRYVDLDKAVIQVRAALEPTKAHGIRFKAPKSKAGRRDITLPDILVAALREYRKAQLELRMKLGAGRLPDDALLFGISTATRFPPMSSVLPGVTSLPASGSACPS
jgi:integrase